MPGSIPRRSTESLRIAMVHSYYSSRVPSGENVVVDLQIAALRRAGHLVDVIARSTDELQTARSYPVRAALRVAIGRGDSPLPEITRARPDVVHVHNLFPNFARRWAQPDDQPHPWPLVATLHNYRPVCPAGILFRDGAGCTECPDTHSVRPAVQHGCYRDSRLATVPIAIGTSFERDPLLAGSDRIIALNDQMRETYAGVGVAREKLTVLPNFVPDPGPPRTHASRDSREGGFWLFVGRLTEEKGIASLVRDWPAGESLRVVGSGPLEDDLREVAGPDVHLLGQLPAAEVRELMSRAKGLIFASIWPEGLPTVYLEALAAGLPTLAAPPSIVGHLVAEQGTGHVMSGDLGADIARARDTFAGLQARCREVFEETYTETAWVAAVTSLYAALL